MTVMGKILWSERPSLAMILTMICLFPVPTAAWAMRKVRAPGASRTDDVLPGGGVVPKETPAQLTKTLKREAEPGAKKEPETTTGSPRLTVVSLSLAKLITGATPV